MKSAIYVGGRVVAVTIDRAADGGYAASADIRVGTATKCFSGAGDTYEAALGDLRGNIVRAQAPPS